MDIVNSLSEYLGSIKNYYSDFNVSKDTAGIWFRGLPLSTYDLIPSLYREVCYKKFEREITRDFYQNAGMFNGGVSYNGIDLLIEMQHYGAPTRLLDWTESCLVALFFAVEQYKITSDGRVWILRPRLFNKAMHGIESIVMTNEVDLSQHMLNLSDVLVKSVRCANPIAIKPMRSNSRILAQSGVFVLYGSDVTPLNEIDECFDCLDYIDIVGTEKKSIYMDLLQCGITYSKVFPELSYFAKEVAERYALKDSVVGMSK